MQQNCWPFGPLLWIRAYNSSYNSIINFYVLCSGLFKTSVLNQPNRVITLKESPLIANQKNITTNIGSFK